MKFINKFLSTIKSGSYQHYDTAFYTWVHYDDGPPVLVRRSSTPANVTTNHQP